MRAIALHDGKPGHRSQALGLVRWLGGGAARACVWPNPWTERIARAALALGFPPSPQAIPALSQDGDLVVAVGTASAVPALALGARRGLPVFSLMAPWGVSAGAFRGRLLPPHDATGGEGEIITLVAPSPMGYTPGPRTKEVALLLGGGRHGRSWPWRAVGQAAAGLRETMEQRGISLLAVPSRRTPSPLTEMVEAEGLGVHSKGGAVGDLLTRVGGVVVTDDSYSMVGEAIQAGFCPMVWRTGGAGRLERGLGELSSRGWIDWSEPGTPPRILPPASPAPSYLEAEAHIKEVSRKVAALAGKAS